MRNTHPPSVTWVISLHALQITSNCRSTFFQHRSPRSRAESVRTREKNKLRWKSEIQSESHCQFTSNIKIPSILKSHQTFESEKNLLIQDLMILTDYCLTKSRILKIEGKRKDKQPQTPPLITLYRHFAKKDIKITKFEHLVYVSN